MIYQLFLSTKPDRLTIRVKNPADDGMLSNLVAESRDLKLLKQFSKYYIEHVVDLKDLADVQKVKESFNHYQKVYFIFYNSHI